jgi:hypothetical protein
MVRPVNTLRGLLRKGRENRYIRGALKVIQVLFVILLVAFPLLLLLEAIWGLSVQAYLSLNHLLLAVIVTGAVAVLGWRGRVEVEEGGRLGRRDIIVAVCAGMAGGVIVWHTMKGMGWFSYFVSVISGALVVLLSMLIMAEWSPWRRGGEEDSEGH